MKRQFHSLRFCEIWCTSENVYCVAENNCPSSPHASTAQMKGDRREPNYEGVHHVHDDIHQPYGHPYHRFQGNCSYPRFYEYLRAPPTLPPPSGYRPVSACHCGLSSQPCMYGHMGGQGMPGTEFSGLGSREGSPGSSSISSDGRYAQFICPVSAPCGYHEWYPHQPGRCAPLPLAPHTHPHPRYEPYASGANYNFSINSGYGPARYHEAYAADPPYKVRHDNAGPERCAPAIHHSCKYDNLARPIL